MYTLRYYVVRCEVYDVSYMYVHTVHYYGHCCSLLYIGFSYRILSYAMSGVASLLLVVLVLINVIVVYFYVRYTRRRRDPERQPILNNLDERQN